MTVQPGDRLSAHVGVSGDTVTVSISDLTRHTTFGKRLQMSSPTVSSAEWIAEAPSRCLSSSSRDCHILSLADFGSVTFTGASASAGGRTGSITGGLGQVSALKLEAPPAFGRLYATAAQANAAAILLGRSHRPFGKFFSKSERTVMAVSGQRVPDPLARITRTCDDANKVLSER